MIRRAPGRSTRLRDLLVDADLSAGEESARGKIGVARVDQSFMPPP